MRKQNLTRSIVRELIDYDQLSGVLTWKRRARRWHKSERDWKRWNNRHAGQAAFTGSDNRASLSGSIFFWMVGRWPNPQVDHENGNPSDNRWRNLREATSQINARNQRLRSTNTSGFNGVRKSSNGRYEVRIHLNGRLAQIGTYRTIEEAVSARLAADRINGYSERHGKPRGPLQGAQGGG